MPILLLSVFGFSFYGVIQALCFCLFHVSNGKKLMMCIKVAPCRFLLLDMKSGKNSHGQQEGNLFELAQNKSAWTSRNA